MPFHILSNLPLCAEAEMPVRQNIEFHKFWMRCENAGMFAGNPIPFSGRRTLCDTLRTRRKRQQTAPSLA
jgi:hypothetical protein